jgi:hypothetical protein
MKTEAQLTVEQEFKLKVYATQTQSLSAEEARILLVEMMRQNMVKDNVIKNFLRGYNNVL